MVTAGIKTDFSRVLKGNPLFSDMPETDIVRALDCLGAKVKTYGKGETVLRADDKTRSVGIVLDGKVHIIRYDFWGTPNIISSIGSGELFAEAYACQTEMPSLVDAVAVSKAKILFISVDKILEGCSTCCGFHQKLIKNLLQIMAKKNIGLIKKIEHISPKSIREKVLAYLSFEAQRQNGATLTLPFDRQQLADYLLVDRSALSKELSKMQKEKLIAYKKNSFTIKKERK